MEDEGIVAMESNVEDIGNKSTMELGVHTCGFFENFIEMIHCFGYQSSKGPNLQLLDHNTVIVAAGSFAILLNIKTKEQKQLQTVCGGSVGYINVHPSHSFFAVAEKGKNPPIAIFDFPSLNVFKILTGGTSKFYAFVDFSLKGDLLASIGGEPDYMLTIWQWKKESILLRTKAFSQDVYRVTFSPFLQGQLTTSGMGHIKFWKMAQTFTGLKLHGEVGRFGKAEISDVYGYVELPDGKVISGSESGLLLLWDGALIKAQIRQKNGKPCHNGTIYQILLEEGELYTIGSDGWIKVWDFENIDAADLEEEAGFLEMSAMNELLVENKADLRHIVKSLDPSDDCIWYAQDGGGALWYLDMSFGLTMKSPFRIFEYPGGVVTGCMMSPSSHLLAVCDTKGVVRIYDILLREVILKRSFENGTTCLLWLPLTVDHEGASFLVGFEDGVVRWLAIAHDQSKEKLQIKLVQASKPHSSCLSCLSINSTGTILATGSYDHTIFFFLISSQKFSPLGFVHIGNPTIHFLWMQSSWKTPENILAFCTSSFVKVQAPKPEDYCDTRETFKLSELKPCQFTVKSIKSYLRVQEQKTMSIEKEQKCSEDATEGKESGFIKYEKNEQNKKNEIEETEDALSVPYKPSSILCAWASNQPSKVWVSLEGFDAGYLYELQIPEDNSDCIELEPVYAAPVHACQDKSVWSVATSTDSQYLLLGQEDGVLTVYKLNEPGNLKSLGNVFSKRIHDCQFGAISHISTSCCGRVIVSAGRDGNIFMHSFNASGKTETKLPNASRIPIFHIKEESNDVITSEQLSLEQECQLAQKIQYQKHIELQRQTIQQKMVTLKQNFNNLLQKDENSPVYFKVEKQKYAVDPNIREALNLERERNKECVKMQFAWEKEKQAIALQKLEKWFKDPIEWELVTLKGFLSKEEVSTFRTTYLPKQLREEIEKFRMRDFLMTSNIKNLDSEITGPNQDMTEKGSISSVKRTSSDSRSISVSTKHKLDDRLVRAAQKLDLKQQGKIIRKSEWDTLLACKPNESAENPNEEAAILEVKQTLGDYKLKTAEDYIVPDHLRTNATKKKQQFLQLERLVHEKKRTFNQRLIALRDTKKSIVQELKKYRDQIYSIKNLLEIPVSLHVMLIPDELDLHEEPEKQRCITNEMLTNFKVQVMDNVPSVEEDKSLNSPLSVQGDKARLNARKAARRASLSSNSSHLTSDHSVEENTSLSFQQVVYDDVAEESYLEKKLKDFKQVRLQYQLVQLEEKTNKLMKFFDARLHLLKLEKLQLEVDLKHADLRLMTLFKEICLLKTFEQQESTLQNKMSQKNQEKREVLNAIKELNINIEGKKQSIESLQKQEHAAQQQFHELIKDGYKFAVFLTRVFKKKTKHSKKKEIRKSYESESESDSSDSSWSNNVDDDSYKEDGSKENNEMTVLDDSICPEGCEQHDFDAVCDLRENKLNIEETLLEEKKSLDYLKKEYEMLSKKLKIIDSGLKGVQEEIEIFQLKKQQELNELDVVVLLHLSQIQYFSCSQEGQLFLNCRDALVFPSDELDRLKERVNELKSEAVYQGDCQRETHMKYQKLARECKRMEKKASELTQQCKKEMTQRFGHVVDLEQLEMQGANMKLGEIQAKQKARQLHHDKVLKEWERNIENKRDRLAVLIKNNSQHLQVLATLTQEKLQLEEELQKKQRKMEASSAGLRQSQREEIKHLSQLVALQAQEIHLLDAEISALKKKCVHIPSPSESRKLLRLTERTCFTNSTT
ncbi:cilia- and flagella-associated protein 44 isoform X2 [Tachypleus tridentatus]|uniref:cilia- and flagella-associated protein 44 isoform X2 n=1 Tax=Tachypleus tridentatus TaxID=6853 RepID=UPI003FD2319B